MSDATDAIIGSVALIGATTVIREVHEKKSGKILFKPIVFSFALGVALLGMAIVAPNFARLLAILGLIGAFVTNGPAVFAVIGGLGK